MSKKHLYWALSLMLAIAIGVGIGYAASRTGGGQKTENSTEDQEQNGDFEDEAEVDENEASSSKTTIAYLSAPELWNSQDVLAPYSQTIKGIDQQNGYTRGSVEMMAVYAQSVTIAKVGTFREGTYKDQSLVNVWEQCEGPCQPVLSRWAVNSTQDEWTRLDAISEESGFELMSKIFTKRDAKFSTPELTAPQTLAFGENAQLILADAFEMEPENARPASMASTSFKSMLQNEGCVFGIFPDGTAARYMIAPKFMKKSDDPITGLSQTLTHAMENGAKTTNTYTLMAQGGCGFVWSCARYVEVTDWSELKPAGTLEGTPVYTLADPSANTDGELNRTFTEVFEGYKMRTTYDTSLTPYKSMSEFLAAQDIYFAKIDENHGTMILSENLTPAAECGKPVIYLYPEQAQEISVKVNIDRFTKTIPAHGKKGWTVWAEPTGQLTNKADGQTYPYLFWEGIKDQPTAELSQSFTLARSEIKTQLPVVLMDLGLTAQETKDFMIFWAPRMLNEESPYLEIAFAGTSAMNEVAPLEISEKPDTLLRIFMVYRPSDESGNSIPDFKTPIRHGFTVVEWGGLLR